MPRNKRAQEIEEERGTGTNVSFSEDLGKDTEVVDREDVLDFFRDNSNPDEEIIENYAKERNYDIEELHEVIYEIVTDHIEMLDADGEDDEMDDGYSDVSDPNLDF